MVSGVGILSGTVQGHTHPEGMHDGGQSNHGGVVTERMRFHGLVDDSGRLKGVWTSRFTTPGADLPLHNGSGHSDHYTGNAVSVRESRTRSYDATRSGPNRPPLSVQQTRLGDFDGDGNIDVLFRHGDPGQVAVWHMNGDWACHQHRRAEVADSVACTSQDDPCQAGLVAMTCNDSPTVSEVTLMKRFLPLALFALLAYVSPAIAIDESASSSQREAVTAQSDFDRQMARMQEQMRKIQAAKDQQERDELLNEHSDSMQQGMQMMHEMWQSGMMGPMGPGMTTEQMARHQQRMHRYMGMQQTMMQHIMGHQGWMMGPGGHMMGRHHMMDMWQ